MAATKAVIVISNNVTIGAGTADPTVGGTYPGQASTINANVSASYGATILIRMTNANPASTTAPRVRVEVSADQTNWYSKALIEGNTTNDSIIQRTIDLHPADMFVRTRSGNTTTNPFDLRAEVEHITAV